MYESVVVRLELKDVQLYPKISVSHDRADAVAKAFRWKHNERCMHSSEGRNTRPLPVLGSYHPVK